MTDTTPAADQGADRAADLAAVRAAHEHTGIGPDHRQVRVAVAGGELTVGVWGPEPSGDRHVPTLLAVHGVSASHRAFGLLARALPGVRVVAPDLRGRGRSNDLPGPYGMPAHADDMAAVVRALADGPVLVLGHSMGAFVSLVLAHRHPNLVTGLLLVDGGIPLAVPEGLDPDAVVQAVLGPAAERLAMTFPGIEDYRRFWRRHPAFPEPWSDLVEDYITYDLEPRGDGFGPSTRYPAMAQDTAELQGGGSLLAALEGLDTDATLLWSPRGLFDETPGLYTEAYLERWSAEVPALARRLRSELVADTNHYSILMDDDGAARVAEEVRRALSSPSL